MLAALLTAYLAAAQHGESQKPPLLNSERIEQRFGSYGIDVLSSDAAVRVSDLYSLEHGRKICRTFAVVLYPAEPDPRYADAHAEILAGGSIGAVFKRHGWIVTKTNLYFGTLAPTPKVAALMHDASGRPLAVHVYGLYVTKDGTTLPYATIAEVHHPDYLTLSRVREIYGGTDAVPADEAGVVQRVLDVTEEKMR
ncbi:MAG TPA: hypothetical protein VFV10_00075 [Gammaproteobacteria bacterium]|nr:hypothetical protein [Gammaproteobacteria bacterium]